MAGGNNPFNPSPGGRRPTFRGIFQRDVTQGVERVRKWPKPRGRAKTAAEKARQDKFKWANQATKYMAPQIVADMTKAVRGTPLMPRDMLIAQLYGRLTMFVLDDGRHLWPKEAVMEVSKALDILSAIEGYTLRRGPTAWEGVPFPTLPDPDDYLQELGGNNGDVLQKVGGLWVPAPMPSGPGADAPERYWLNAAIHNVTGDGTAWTVPYNAVSSAGPNTTLNPANGQITVNVAGVYQFAVATFFEGGSTQAYGTTRLMVDGVERWQSARLYPDNWYKPDNFATTLALDAGDVVTIIATLFGGPKQLDTLVGETLNTVSITRIG